MSKSLCAGVVGVVLRCGGLKPIIVFSLDQAEQQERCRVPGQF